MLQAARLLVMGISTVLDFALLLMNHDNDDNDDDDDDDDGDDTHDWYDHNESQRRQP